MMTPEQELKMLANKYGKLMLISAMKDFITAENSNMEQNDWDMLAPRYGLDPNLYNASFRHNGHTFFLRKIKPNNRKYPVIAERDDGRSYKFSSEFVLAQSFFTKVF